MGSADDRLTPLDALYLQRAYELAARGIGNTAPNPPVGAVIARDGRWIAEGSHHRAGEAHAEVEALHRAGPMARGATLYVSLEPCPHFGRTPPCTEALLEAGIARVVAGTTDPSAHGGGAALLAARGVEVTVADAPAARALVEEFARTSRGSRPYVALKMAMSLDGAVARTPGIRETLTGEQSSAYVRELRAAYDAVMVGANTVRVDDPQLTVRPPRNRLRPYRRIVLTESGELALHSRIFTAQPGYERTIVVAPSARRAAFKRFEGVADVVFAGDPRKSELDLPSALEALRARDIGTILCEGGPTLAASLIAARAVDRFYWAIAPVMLANQSAVPVLLGRDVAELALRPRFDRLERLGDDVLIGGTFDGV